MSIPPFMVRPIGPDRFAYRYNGAWLPEITGSAPLVADGTDQTANWVGWLASVPDGTAETPTSIALPAGNFRLDNGLRVAGRSHLRITGPTSGTPFTAYVGGDSDELDLPTQMGVDLTRCTDVVASYIGWTGPNDERAVYITRSGVSSGGTFTITIGAQTTGPIPATAAGFTAAAVRDAVRALGGVFATADATGTGTAATTVLTLFYRTNDAVVDPTFSVTPSVTGGTVLGGTPFARYVEAKAFDHAFAIRSGSVECGIEHCTYRNVYGDGFYGGFQNEGVANVDCWAKFVVGTYCGRNNASLTNVDGFLLEDCDFDYGGFAGVNYEPNSANDKVWDAVCRRVRSGSRFNPFVCTGANNGPLPQRKNLSYIDCEVIRCANSHVGLSISRPPIPASNAGELLVDGFVDHRNSTIYGLDLSAIWPKVTVRNCDVWTSAAAAYAVRVRCAVFDEEDGWQPGDLTIEDNDFSGGTRGFAHLLLDLSSPPADVVESGNSLA